MKISQEIYSLRTHTYLPSFLFPFFELNSLDFLYIYKYILYILCSAQCYESLQLMTLENAEEIPATGSSIECLGNLLRIWECNWCGTKNDFPEHFIRCHNNIEIFSQFQVSSVPFIADQVLSAMTLVKAFDSSFIFYYHSNPSKKMIYFLVFLLNEAEQPKPESYLYELMIKSKNENHCKVIN